MRMRAVEESFLYAHDDLANIILLKIKKFNSIPITNFYHADSPAQKRNMGHSYGA